MAPLDVSAISIPSTSLINLSSSRHRPPSIAPQREEGWTEVWGGKDCKNIYDGNTNAVQNSNDDDESNNNMPYLPPRYITVLKDGCDYTADGRVKPEGVDSARTPGEDTPSLKLTQHRVAWLEQIVLRMNYIPHGVENSGYSCLESTGGLPCLLDMPTPEHRQREDSDDKNNVEEDEAKDDVAGWGRAWGKSLSLLNKPVLIGRNQPGGMGSSFFHQFHHRGDSSSTDLYPPWFLPSGSHIVDYLRLKHSRQMKNNLLFPEHLRGNQLSGDAVAYEAMIQDKLNYILLALRYGNVPAWEGVYRPQCILAALHPNGKYDAVDSRSNFKSFFPLRAWYQTYLERSLALQNLLPSPNAIFPSTHGGLALELFRYNDHRHSSQYESFKSDEDDKVPEENEVHQHHPFSSFFPSHGGVGGGDTGRVNVYRAMEYAGLYYASLEERLTSSRHREGANGSVGDGSSHATSLLGTEKPTYIDALLFAHLAEALCDVHLVLVLAKHSHLIKYFQWMYYQYFGEGYAKLWALRCARQGVGESANWIHENNVANKLNAFNQVPEATPTKQPSRSVCSVHGEGQDMVRALHLMRQMAVHCTELDKALQDAVVLRTADGREREVLQSYHRPIGSGLYRWLVGDDAEFWGTGESKPALDDDMFDMDDGNNDDSQSDVGDDKESSSEEDERRRKLREQVKKLKRDRRTQDELWLSGVAVAIFVVFLLSASGKSKR